MIMSTSTTVSAGDLVETTRWGSVLVTFARTGRNGPLYDGYSLEYHRSITFDPTEYLFTYTKEISREVMKRLDREGR